MSTVVRKWLAKITQIAVLAKNGQNGSNGLLFENWRFLGSEGCNEDSVEILGLLLLRRKAIFLISSFGGIFFATPDRAQREQPIGGLGLCVCARVRSV